MSERVWLDEPCPPCRRRHRVSLQPCPSCQGRGGFTPQPVSETVHNRCGRNYQCDGCLAYEDHLR